MLSRADLENQLFLLRSGSTTSVTYKGRDRARWGPWMQRRDSLWWGRTNTPPRLALSMSAWVIWGNTCQQPYSPVASWMEDADVALNDEGQQYGNLDEASAIARVPRKCPRYLVWRSQTNAWWSEED